MRECFGDEFDVPAGYCNTASIGVPPQSVLETMLHAVRRWGSGGDDAKAFDEPMARSRAGFAQLIGVDESRVAIGSSASTFVGAVAASLAPKSRILVHRNDFASVTYPFVLAGHEVTAVDGAELVARAAEHDVVAVSSVQSSDGEVLDVDALLAARGDARVLLDVTQALGWQRLALDRVDYVVCAGYKWLMAPRGCAWFAVRDEHLSDLQAAHSTWFAGADRWNSLYGVEPRLAEQARRFDESPSWWAHLGAAESIEWLLARDLDAIRDHDLTLINALATGLGLAPVHSPILSIDLGERADRLAAAGIRVAGRAGRSRFGLHLYNTMRDVELVLDALS